MWYVTASVAGSNNSGLFLAQVARTPNVTPYPDGSVTPTPICRWVRVLNVLGKTPAGTMGALVAVHFDSFARYGNSPRKLSRAWTLQDNIKVPVYARVLPPGGIGPSSQQLVEQDGQRSRSIIEEVRYGVGDVTDSMRETATLAVGRIFVFGTIPYRLKSHRFDSVGSGYWSVSYRFETLAPTRGVPEKPLDETTIGEAIPALDWLEEWQVGGKKLGVRTVNEMYGPAYDLSALPGF